MGSSDEHLGPFQTLEQAREGVAVQFRRPAALVGSHDHYAAVAIDISDAAEQSKFSNPSHSLVVLLTCKQGEGWQSCQARNRTGWVRYPDDPDLGVWIEAAHEEPVADAPTSARCGPRHAIMVGTKFVTVTWDVERSAVPPLPPLERQPRPAGPNGGDPP